MAIRLDPLFRNTLDIPDDASETEVEQAMNEYRQTLENARKPGQTLSDIGTMAAQVLAVPNSAPQSTLAGLSGKDVWGMTPEQTNATLNRIQQSNQYSQQSAMQRQQMAREQLQFEKARGDELKLQQQRQKNFETQQKMEERQLQAYEKRTNVDVEQGKARTEAIKAGTEGQEWQNKALQEEVENPKSRWEQGPMGIQYETTPTGERITHHPGEETQKWFREFGRLTSRNPGISPDEVVVPPDLREFELLTGRKLADIYDYYVKKNVDVASELTEQRARLASMGMSEEQLDEHYPKIVDPYAWAKETAIIQVSEYFEGLQQMQLIPGEAPPVGQGPPSPGGFADAARQMNHIPLGEPVETPYGIIDTASDPRPNGGQYPILDFSTRGSPALMMNSEELLKFTAGQDAIVVTKDGQVLAGRFRRSGDNVIFNSYEGRDIMVDELQQNEQNKGKTEDEDKDKYKGW